VADGLLAGNADGVAFGLDVQVALFDPWHFKDRHQAVALLKDIDGRERSSARSSTSQPVAF